MKSGYTEIIIRNFKTGKEKARVLIDTKDTTKAKTRKWSLEKKGYAVSGGRKKPTVRIHAFLIGNKEGFEVDHKNQNKLDNRRENLRHVSHHQNTLNRKQSGDGVSFRKERGKWRARVKWKGKEKCLGHFFTEQEALKAREDYIKSKGREIIKLT